VDLQDGLATEELSCAAVQAHATHKLLDRCASGLTVMAGRVSRRELMRSLILSLGIVVTALPVAATPADAQGYRNREVRREMRECRRELRRAESRREYNRELRECRRELAQARRSGRWDRWDRRWRNW
jgi:hypothetical protein